MVVSDYIPCFNADDIRHTFEANRVTTETPPGVIYVTAGMWEAITKRTSCEKRRTLTFILFPDPNGTFCPSFFFIVIPTR